MKYYWEITPLSFIVFKASFTYIYRLVLIVNCQGHLLYNIWYLCIIDSVLLISLLRRLTLTRTLIHRWPAQLWSLTTKEQRCFKYEDYMLMSLVLITNVKVTDVYYKYDGDEETLKGLVAEHGAVVTTYESHSWPKILKIGLPTNMTLSFITCITIFRYF